MGVKRKKSISVNKDLNIIDIKNPRDLEVYQ
jgi:hypothetical protein